MGGIFVTASLIISTLSSTAYIYTQIPLFLYIAVGAVSIFSVIILIGLMAILSQSPMMEGIRPSVVSILASMVLLGNSYFLFQNGYSFLSGVFFCIIIQTIIIDIILRTKQ